MGYMRPLTLFGYWTFNFHEVDLIVYQAGADTAGGGLFLAHDEGF